MWLAYPGLFLALAGDAVRYSIGWGGWSVAVVSLTLASIYALAVSKPVELIRTMPTALMLLLGWMMLSLTWSSYLGASFMMIGLQISATLFALVFSQPIQLAAATKYSFKPNSFHSWNFVSFRATCQHYRTGNPAVSQL